MPDNVKITAGSGDDTVAPPVATDLIGGAHYQRIKAGWGADGVWVEPTDADGSRMPIGGAQLGALTEAAPGSDIASSGLNGRLQRVAQRLSSLILLLPTALGTGGGLKVDGSGTPLPVSGTVASTQSGTWTVQPGNTPNGVRWKVDSRERAIVGGGSTVTRPANVTPYSANDAISNNATPASVTPVLFGIAESADQPVVLERLRVITDDTGLAAGVVLRAYLYTNDPTSASGVVGGDNLPFSTKRGGFIGCMSGSFRPFSDGGIAILVPEEGARIITIPGSGTTNIYALYQVLSAFTPSANGTVLIPLMEAFQALA